MRAGHVPAVGLRANVVLPKYNASQTECLLMARPGSADRRSGGSAC
jgi:hypothetical protein